MVRDPVFIILLVLAGALGVAGSTAVAFSFLDEQIGIAGIAGLFTYIAGFIIVILTTLKSSTSAFSWIMRCLVPIPMVLIVFFGLRFLGF